MEILITNHVILYLLFLSKFQEKVASLQIHFCTIIKEFAKLVLIFLSKLNLKQNFSERSIFPKFHKKYAEGVTWRAVLLSIVLTPINVYLVVQWETVWGTQYPTTMGIFFSAIFCLLVLIGINRLIHLVVPNQALVPAELLTIYAMLSMAITVSGHDFSQTIFCTVAISRWYATPENEWANLFWHYVPDWLSVNDFDLLNGFFRGESYFLQKNYVLGWLQPMIWWSTFLTVTVFTMLCLTVIIRRQWIEKEKLGYPLVHLPQQMVLSTPREDRSILSNRLLWVGVGLATTIDLLNGFAYLLPHIPSIPMSYDLHTHFTSRPLNAMGKIPIQWNPYVIGLAFPIPLDLLFSCWVLFLVWKVERLFGSIVGINTPNYPFPDQQILGAYLGIALVALWLARKPLAQIAHGLIKGKNEHQDEPMSYHTAAVGLLLGFIFLVLFSYQAGMSMAFSVSFFVIYFFIAFGFTRMRAELGPPLQGIHYSGPLQLIVAVLGSRRLSRSTLTASAPYWTFTKEIRNNPMPFLLENFKLAESAGINTRKLCWAMMLAVCVSAFLTFFVFLQLSYQYGSIGAGRGRTAYTIIERWLNKPQETDIPFLLATLVGFVIVLFNTVLRLRFIWWQLHPLGYPLAGYYHFEKLWFPFFLSWLIKWICIKQGGIKSYRRLLPFFLGLVLGEFICGSVWGIIGLITSERTYTFKNW